jgi:hypothetical protein
MRRFTRRLLLALPALAVGVVLWAVLTAGAPAAVDVARVVGGPTRGAPSLSWLLSISRLEDGRRAPRAQVALQVLGRALGVERSWRGKSDALGQVEARLDFPAPLPGAVWLRVEDTDRGRVLAEGTADLDVDAWQAAAHHEGGWFPGRQAGPIALRVAARDGALAVPFAGALLIDASWASEPTPALGGQTLDPRPAVGIALDVELVGAERTAPETPLVTDAQGQAELLLRPLEHAVRLQLSARSAASARDASHWDGAVPVIPGALSAERVGPELRVRSPIPRERAYLSLVTRRQRLSGALLALAPDADGGSSGSVALEPRVLALLETEASFAVVSSEYDKRSPSAVGWPLGPARGTPRETFDVPDQPLLDGTERALALEAERRHARRRLAALWLTLIGVLLAALFWYEVRAGRKSARDAFPLSAMEAGASPIALEPQRWILVVAVACILLGMAALARFETLAR